MDKISFSNLTLSKPLRIDDDTRYGHISTVEKYSIINLTDCLFIIFWRRIGTLKGLDVSNKSMILSAKRTDKRERKSSATNLIDSFIKLNP